jgi:RNA polymerase sigma factor (sigma-70 family)
MHANQSELIPTRASLLARLKNLEDHASWQDFFETYWKLIYGVSVKRGLTPTEAEDVVQETMCAVMKHMPGFNYDSTIGSFKGWLLKLVRWRIADQFRKRAPMRNLPHSTKVDTSEILDDVADPKPDTFETLWNLEWEQALFDAAVVKTRRTLDPQKFQIFDLLVKQQVSPTKVAENFSISVDQVYLAKHRVSQQIKAEVERLKQRVI